MAVPPLPALASFLLCRGVRDPAFGKLLTQYGNRLLTF